MAAGAISLRGEDVYCELPEGGPDARILLPGGLSRLREWAQRYDVASHRDREGELVAIGCEMFDWLDKAGWASAWADRPGDRRLEILAGAVETDTAATLLDAPWELLARNQRPLALDDQMLQVVRRVGVPVTAAEPAHGDIRLMFMSAAPLGQTVLDYEAEEAGIVRAAGSQQRLKLVVEETGSLDVLASRLTSNEGPFEVLHLSCHGDIVPERGPVLLLETLAGDPYDVAQGDLARALGERKPPLVVLSACRTAERGPAAGTGNAAVRREASFGLEPAKRHARSTLANAGPELASPFARRLATMVANVVGWDGSVYDRDATYFASTFYEELAKGVTIPYAAAVARQALLRLHAQDTARGRHWHLARVYAGPAGGGAIRALGKPARPASTIAREFLDTQRQEVPVASRETFVGRRRAIQSVLRAFLEGRNVLVYGMGAVGKSSVAARVSGRTALRSVVVFRRYDALAIFDRVAEVMPAQPRLDWQQLWREQVAANAARLGEALEDGLSNALFEAPILLIIDDLERILEAPSPGGGSILVTQAYRAALSAVFRGFARAADATQCQSRLLLTSRYDFSLPDGAGGDLAHDLWREHLGPMDQRERHKQVQASGRTQAGSAPVLVPEDQALIERAIAAAGGNPGLQAVLTRPILAGQRSTAERTIGQVEAFLRTGAPPQELQTLIDAGTAPDQAKALVAFFRRLSFETYRAALSDDEARVLGAATLFSEGVPAPLRALAAAGAGNGSEAPDKAIDRLLSLGLFDDWRDMDGHHHAAANVLVRLLAPAIAQADRRRLARAVTPELVAAWRDTDGEFPRDARSVDAAWLAIEADEDTQIVDASARAAARFLCDVRHDVRQAHELARAAIDLITQRVAIPSAELLLVGIDVAERLGEIDALKRNMAAADALTEESNSAAGSLLLRKAQIAGLEGRLDDALQHGRRAEQMFASLDLAHGRATALSEIADVLEVRGDLDEALRIRREELLPVYDQLGDVGSRAIAMGKIADVLQARGQLDEALRIRREELLPVYDQLGDVRSRAITMGKIADVLQARGQLDEALRIRREEQLPVFDQLGDVGSRAIAMGKIADVLQARGELGEALRIRREELLPVFARVGDTMSALLRTTR